jgi:phospholipid/cholesterol/gamma-HCH transport system substrate-binding protein
MARFSLPQASGLRRLLPLLVVGALVIAAVVALVNGGGGQKTVSADFPRTVSVYPGSDVRVLGVKVGQIESVTPTGTTVKVEMTYDEGVKLPADAKAAIIAPSVVGDRFVQFTPVYQGGDVLEDGAKLGSDRTAVPLELDDIYQNLNDFAVGLGPDGANKEGALTRLLRTTARNFGGQGKQFNETIRNLSRFTSTLDNNKEELFGATRQIEVFVQALAENDQTVRDFNDSLASASDLLADERADLAAALRNLATAVTEVRTFVRDNRTVLSQNIKGLVRVTDVLVKQRRALDEVLQIAPTALSNLYHTYNPSSGTLDTRANLGQNISALETRPADTLCSLVATFDDNGDLCDQFQDALGRTAPDGVGAALTGRTPVEIEPIDTTLAGILGGTR